MRIGRLRKRLRCDQWNAEPEYYSCYAHHKAFSNYHAVMLCPFDGKAFLTRNWRFQDANLWFGYSYNGLIPMAAIGYRIEWRKESESSDKYFSFLLSFRWPYTDIIVFHTSNLEGVWIENGKEKLITVLETTRVQMEFDAETCEVILPPGTTVQLSPLTLMKKLNENINEKRIKDIPENIRSTLASAKTPQELAVRLKLEPIKLQEKLEDKGEVMRR